MDAVLFLDFDGVLHPFGCQAGTMFCKLALLQDWLRRRPGLDVVVSSSWRITRTLDELRSPFAADLRPRVVGVTPVLRQEAWSEYEGESPPSRHERHVESLRWLVSSDRPWRPWAALDDQAWLFKPFTGQLVLCDGSVGLTQTELDMLDQVLNSSPPPGH